MPSEEEYEEALNNLGKNNWIVDYVITHDASTEVIQDLTIFNMPNKIRNFFSVIDSKLTYRQWFFGHHHQNLEIDRRHTLLCDKIIKIEEYDMQEPIKDKAHVNKTED